MFDSEKYGAIKFDLDLKLPVRLILSEKSNKHSDAYYVPIYNNKGILTSHKITIFFTSCARNIDTLIVHELIHAWQEENKYKEVHGKKFREWAEYFEREYFISNIYIPRTDKK